MTMSPGWEIVPDWDVPWAWQCQNKEKILIASMTLLKTWARPYFFLAEMASLSIQMSPTGGWMGKKFGGRGQVWGSSHLLPWYRGKIATLLDHLQSNLCCRYFMQENKGFVFTWAKVVPSSDFWLSTLTSGNSDVKSEHTEKGRQFKER